MGIMITLHLMWIKIMFLNTPCILFLWGFKHEVKLSIMLIILKISALTYALIYYYAYFYLKQLRQSP